MYFAFSLQLIFKKAVEENLLPDNEKLCSVINYCSGSALLQNQLALWREEGMSESVIAGLIEQKDLEKISILIWIGGERDAHLGNILIYPGENGLYHLKKIDHGYSFSEANRQALYSGLADLAQSERALSEEGKELIQHIAVEPILEEMEYLRLSQKAQEALIKRLSFLQELIKERDLSLREIHEQLNEMHEAERLAQEDFEKALLFS